MRTKIQNPYLNALIPVGAVAVMSLIATLVSWLLSSIGRDTPIFFWISIVFFVFFSLIWFVIWLLGARKKKQIREFLNSDRPLMRWTYSAVDWKQIKELNWREEHQDWKLQWGCLSLLMAAAGGLTGAMLGMGEGMRIILIRAIIGLLIGVGVGLLIGGMVAGGNHLASWLAYRREQPAQVALAPGEIFTGFDYFRADGRTRFINDVKLTRGQPDMLEFTLIFPPRPRMPLEETWAIAVPARLYSQVDQIRSSLVSYE